MPLFSEDQDKIYSDLIADVLANTNITRFTPGSKMRALVEALSNKMNFVWSTFDLNVGQAFVDGAAGEFLDLIGSLLNVERLNAAPATLSIEDKLIKFYVDVGTFGTINSGSSFTITKGTVISTAPSNAGTKYRVLVDTLIDPTESEAFVAAESFSTGSRVNVGAKTLKYHDFTGYADVANGTLKVTNPGEIVLGQNQEDDTNYRYRITNTLLALERANMTAVRLSALSVPGVSNIVEVPFHRGIGTYDILIESVSPYISQSLINNVQLAIEAVSSAGIVPVARGPKEIGFAVRMTLTVTRALSPQEKTDLITSVRINTTDYINGLGINEDFIVNELVERVLATSSLIKNVGVANKPFDKMYIYKPSLLEDNKVRELLLTDLTIDVDERLVIENIYAGATPVTINIAV